MVREVEDRGFCARREGGNRVNWASFVFGTLQSAVQEGGDQRVNIEWVSWDMGNAKNRLSGSCEDKLAFFVDLEKVKGSYAYG